MGDAGTSCRADASPNERVKMAALADQRLSRGYSAEMDLDLSNVKTNEQVPLTSRDRYFFNELNRFMSDESAKIGTDPSRERFAVFRLAFEKVTLVSRWKNVLNIDCCLSPRSSINRRCTGRCSARSNKSMNDASTCSSPVPRKSTR